MQSHKNFEKYYPIEMDPTVPLEKKKALMLEWRTCQFALMLNAGLTRDVIKQTVQSDMISFRSGYEDFFDILKNGNIPLLIFSATGLGYEAIYFCLENVHKLSDNINIISNSFIRDEKGRALAVRQPIIHSYNK